MISAEFFYNDTCTPIFTRNRHATAKIPSINTVLTRLTIHVFLS